MIREVSSIKYSVSSWRARLSRAATLCRYCYFLAISDLRKQGKITISPIRGDLRLKTSHPRAAFTLIETALALLAIGLGLLTIFGLGRMAQQNTRASLNDQRCELFANSIFETLRESNAYFVELARTNIENRAWIDYWQEAIENDTIEMPALPGVATTRTPLRLQFTREGSESAKLAFDPNHISLSAWNPHYHIYLNENRNSLHTSLIRINLLVYPSGDLFSTEPYRYTTTLSDHGGLP